MFEDFKEDEEENKRNFVIVKLIPTLIEKNGPILKQSKSKS